MRGALILLHKHRGVATNLFEGCFNGCLQYKKKLDLSSKIGVISKRYRGGQADAKNVE